MHESADRKALAWPNLLRNWMNLYPRSFLRMILLGNVMVMLPLLAAVMYASLDVVELTRRSDDAVRQALQAATVGHHLEEELTQMERLLRQYEVLSDRALLGEYAAVHAEWQRSVDEYMAIPILSSMLPAMMQIQQREINAFEAIEAGRHRPGKLQLEVAELRRSLVPLLEEANTLLNAEREDFHHETDEFRHRLMLALLSALTLSVILLWFSRRMIATLWSRFERAIQALGEGKLDRRIRLKGPEDLQRVGQRLEWLRRRMAELERERTRVMRHASHELKTPLAALREGASLLHEGLTGSLSPQQARIAAIMQSNALRLQVLIDALLSLQQAGYARDKMETGPVRLDQVIEEILATHQLAARSRHVRISGSLAPLTIEGNREGLATLANNLVANAIKYSPDGGHVRIGLSRENDIAMLDVQDDGPGIRPEDRERIFEPFYRGMVSKDVAGVGLGLAISREFALAHRGTLEILEAGIGAHFRAKLPLAQVAL